MGRTELGSLNRALSRGNGRPYPPKECGAQSNVASTDSMGEAAPSITNDSASRACLTPLKLPRLATKAARRATFVSGE